MALHPFVVTEECCGRSTSLVRQLRGCRCATQGRRARWNCMQLSWNCWARSALTAPGCRQPTRRPCRPRRRMGAARRGPRPQRVTAEPVLLPLHLEHVLPFPDVCLSQTHPYLTAFSPVAAAPETRRVRQQQTRPSKPRGQVETLSDCSKLRLGRLCKNRIPHLWSPDCHMGRCGRCCARPRRALLRTRGWRPARRASGSSGVTAPCATAYSPVVLLCLLRLTRSLSTCKHRLLNSQALTLVRMC